VSFEDEYRGATSKSSVTSPPKSPKSSKSPKEASKEEKESEKTSKKSARGVLHLEMDDDRITFTHEKPSG
jgi:hypothetical protein